MSRTQSDLERYLRQQKELYGDVVYIEAAGRNKAARSQTVSGIVDDPSTDIHGQDEGDWKSAPSLGILNEQICECRKCPLGETRTRFVFGVGNPSADLVVIGEAPGAEEDRQGEPFVGRAGQLLNQILQAVKFNREDVFICNILKCRPPNNRDPQSSEVEQCEPYLRRQLELLSPKIILALGRIAGQTLLKTNDSLAVLRSRMHTYQGIPLMVTYHPAALLRNPQWKKPTWDDVQKLRALYDDVTGQP
jgi:uracil-DNA glycosylase